MSRFFSEKYSSLVPYTPGEQPKDMKYIKLNTNESPFPPSPATAAAAAEAAKILQLYSDPDSSFLTAKLAEVYKAEKGQLTVSNGSDETLNFAFMAFADEKRPLAFADISYGFYPVCAALNNIPFCEIPLKEDFTIDVNDYTGINKTIVIANPNAPTGLALPLHDIEKIVSSNPSNVVIVDEAYVDFGAESAVGLINKYDNLLVVQTFSKSRSLAGARLGFAIGNEQLIKDLNTIKYSTNPYNVNRMSCMAGYAALCDNDYYINNCSIICRNREWTMGQLEKLNFTVLESKANFIFAKSEAISGFDLYSRLKQRGILVRHFNKKRISDFIRITIGTAKQMEAFIATLREITEDLSE